MLLSRPGLMPRGCETSAQEPEHGGALGGHCQCAPADLKVAGQFFMFGDFS